MIIGVFIRGYKAFQTTTYIPLTEGTNFSALVGDNGVGKSSVLEALDTFFNNRPFNRNKLQSKRGDSALEYVAFVAPIFVLSEDDLLSLDDSSVRLVKAISQYFKNIPDSAKPLAAIKNHIKDIPNLDKKYIVPLARYSDDRKFNCALPASAPHKALGDQKKDYGLTDEDFGEIVPDEITTLKHLGSLREEIIRKYSYIYIPVEANEEELTKLEGKTVERLTDSILFSEIAKLVDASKIAANITEKLDSYLSDIQKELAEFEYHSEYRRKFTDKLLVEKILEGYFSTKTLHKKSPRVRINDLSAGEKRQAILSFSIALLERAAKAKESSKKLVFALDEPEASLHISRIYDQLEKLRSISKSCAQVIVTTHWYGFIPILDEGWVQSLVKQEAEIDIDSIDLADFYHQTRRIKEGTKGKRPLDMTLKGNSEFVQSIINSVCKLEPYYWIICEGVTDALYIQTFLQKYNYPKVRIIPVAGAPNVSRLNRLLYPIINDYKDDVRSTVLCLIDTDKQLPSTTGMQDDLSSLLFRRLCNDDNGVTNLLKWNSTVSGITTIEDVLPPELYIQILDSYADELGFKPSEKKRTGKLINSQRALDLKETEREKLREFFGAADGKNKVDFANKFCAAYPNNTEEPAWIKEVLALLQLK